MAEAHPFPACGVAFASLAVLAAMTIVALGADVPIFVALNGTTAGWERFPWQNITIVGDGVVAATLMLALYGRRPDLLWAAFFAVILLACAVHLGKYLHPTLRPLGLLGPAVHVIGGQLRGSSFPSGHSATAFAIAAILFPAKRLTALQVMLLLAAGAVALSRIAVGAHWPSDVLAGGAGGWLIGLASLALARRFPWGCMKLAQTLLACVFMLPAVWLLAGYDTAYPAARPLAIIIGIVSITAFCWALARPASARLQQSGISG